MKRHSLQLENQNIITKQLSQRDNQFAQHVSPYSHLCVTRSPEQCKFPLVNSSDEQNFTRIEFKTKETQFQKCREQMLTTFNQWFSLKQKQDLLQRYQQRNLKIQDYSTIRMEIKKLKDLHHRKENSRQFMAQGQRIRINSQYDPYFSSKQSSPISQNHPYIIKKIGTNQNTPARMNQQEVQKLKIIRHTTQPDSPPPKRRIVFCNRQMKPNICESDQQYDKQNENIKGWAKENKQKRFESDDILDIEEYLERVGQNDYKHQKRSSFM